MNPADHKIKYKEIAEQGTINRVFKYLRRKGVDAEDLTVLDADLLAIKQKRDHTGYHPRMTPQKIANFIYGLPLDNKEYPEEVEPVVKVQAKAKRTGIKWLEAKRLATENGIPEGYTSAADFANNASDEEIEKLKSA